MLFMPGNNPGMLQDAAILGADAIILDLEDAVSLTEKDSARILVREAIKTIDYSQVEVVVRVNPLDTEFGPHDVDVIARVKPDTLLIPKANEQQIKLVDTMLDKIEEEEGYIAGSIKIIALIETAIGLATVYDVIKASKRVVGVLLGGEDLTADLGIRRTKAEEELKHALRVLTAMEEAEKEGKGVCSLDGKMIDAPVINRAKRTVDQGIR